MKRTFLAFVLVALVTAVPAAASADSPDAAQAAGIKTGAVLLDKLTATFKHLAESGTGGREALEQAMQELITGARQARAQKQIDAVFFFKFNRLMTVIQLAIVEDPQGILGSIVDREVGDFIEEVTGEKVTISSKEGKGVGLASIADALANEILNLRIYLDTLPRREAMRQEFYKQFSPSPKE